jgi:hypothetical protein
MTDLYRILGVSPRATTAEIKSAYRRLARKFHPDVSASPDANTHFARINEAYRILSDPKRRAIYDQGRAVHTQRTFYASRDAEVVAYQRKFDRMVDEMIARERQEAAARSHAVMIVVTLFVSAFYVTLTKPMIIEELSWIGRALLIGLALYGLLYLVRNLAIVLARYTYDVPNQLISVFKEERPRDKIISRKAALVFLVCGYLASLGLGYVLGRIALPYDVSPGTVLGIFIYPPIAVLIISGFRKLGSFLDQL